MSYENKVESMKILLREAAWSAKKCHQILFNDNYDSQKTNELIAAIYLNKAISFMTSAKSLYISNYETLEHHQVESIFEKFSIFESEFLKNLSTGHSHQWTDITYQDFKDHYESLLEKL